MNFFLIIGMSRSGTTLLEKLLASHPQMNLFSQPLPLLYRHLKKEFYKKINYPDTYYVLNDLFHESEYSPDDFFDFLDHYELPLTEISQLFEEMLDWNGQWEKVMNWNEWMSNYNSMNLAEFYPFFLKNLSAGNGIKAMGSKEVLVEEFIPYLIQNGIKVIHIIRDPRDIITSLNVGRGPEYAGAHRPTLFHLRNWRKSISIANSYMENDHLLSVRYEDLINGKYAILELITDFLETDAFENGCFSDGIRTGNGALWQGNSSTKNLDGIDETNQKKYRKYLDADTIKYIEYTCRPEMLLNGYELDYEVELKSYDPFRFKELFPVQVHNLNQSLSTDKKEIELEHIRQELLKKGKPSGREIEEFFYTKQNFQRLKINSI